MDETTINASIRDLHIAPRNWELARDKYLNTYEQPDKYWKEVHGEEGVPEHLKSNPGNVTVSESASLDIKYIAEHLQDCEFQLHPRTSLRIHVSQSPYKGPPGWVSVCIKAIPKLKSGMTPKSVYQLDSLAITPDVAQARRRKLTVHLAAHVQYPPYCFVRCPGSKALCTSFKNTWGIWTPISNRLRELAKDADLYLQEAAYEFTGSRCSTIEKADHAIDVEVERRICKERARTTKPIHDRFWKLPHNVHLNIWKYAMNVGDRVKPFMYQPTWASRCEWANPWSIAHTPTSLRSVDMPPWFMSNGQSLRQATAEALYSLTTFSFTCSRTLHQFLDKLEPSCLWLVRHPEIQLGAENALRYFQQYLGFMHGLEIELEPSHNKWSPKADGTLTALSSGCKQAHLTVVLPSKADIRHACTVDECHLLICKSLAMAVGLCGRQFPKVKLELRNPVQDGKVALSASQMQDLLEISRMAALTSRHDVDKLRETITGADVGASFKFPSCLMQWMGWD